MPSDLSTQEWSDRSDFVRPIYKLAANLDDLKSRKQYYPYTL